MYDKQGGIMKKKINQIKKTLLKPYMQKITGDTHTPVTLYQKFVGKGIGFLLESNEHPKGRYSFLGRNPYLIIEGRGKEVMIYLDNKPVESLTGNPLEIAKGYMEQYTIEHDSQLPFVGGAVGSIGYDMIRQYEKLDNMNQDTMHVPDLHLLFVKEVIAYDHETNCIYIIVLEEDSQVGAVRGRERIRSIDQELSTTNPSVPPLRTSSSLTKLRSHMNKDDFISAVKRAKTYIYEGDIFQVVLSRRWSGETEEEAFNIYRRLRQVNPSPYMFYLDYGTYQVAGSSPEMLVELVGERIRNCPIAGTRGRGGDPIEDQYLAESLLHDEKERAEHTMLVDLGRNDMGKVAQIGTVNLKQFMKVQKYAHVMHLVSLVEGKKSVDVDMFQVLMSFLPAGTLSGAPKIRAMEIIDELEQEKRGIYGGAIGYFGFNGHMDMCIAIRTMIIKEGRIYLQAGAGIVADSDEIKEYEETQKKVKGLVVALKKEVADDFIN